MFIVMVVVFVLGYLAIALEHPLHVELMQGLHAEPHAPSGLDEQCACQTDVVQSEGIELFVVGDALIPRNLSSAVHDGYRIGMRV